jgi:hypothetical protein
MSLTTIPETAWSVTSTRCSPAAGADEHDSETGASVVVTPGAGLGNVLPPVDTDDGLEAAEAEADGEWLVACDVELLPHAATTRRAARARSGRRFLTGSRILPAGGWDS